MKIILSLIFTLLLVGCNEKETVKEVVQPIYIERDSDKQDQNTDSQEQLQEQKRKIAATKECMADEIRHNLATVQATCEEILNREPRVIQIDSSCSDEPIKNKCESQSFIQDYEIIQIQMTELDKLEFQLLQKTQCSFQIKGMKDNGKDLDLILSNCLRSPDEEKYADIFATINRYLEISNELLESEHLFARQISLLKEKKTHLNNYKKFLTEKLFALLENYHRITKNILTKNTDSRSKARCSFFQKQYRELFQFLGNQSRIMWQEVQADINSCLNN